MTYPTVPLPRNNQILSTTRPLRRLVAGRTAGRVAVLLAADGLACFAAGGAVTGWLGPSARSLEPPASLPLLLILAAVAGYAALQGRYTRAMPVRQDLQLVVQASLYAIALEVVLGIGANDLQDRVPALAVLAIFPVFATILNGIVRRALRWAGLWQLSVVMAGDSTAAARPGAKGWAEDGAEYRIAGRIDLSSMKARLDGIPIRSLLSQYGASRLVIAAGGAEAAARELAEIALLEGIPVSVALRLPGPEVRRHGMQHRLDGDGVVLCSYPTWPAATARMVKSAMDVAGACLLLLILAPVMPVIALLIRRDGGPALFVHRRIGFRGRHFGCLKFRTMAVGAERHLQEVLARDPALAAEWRATHKLRHDPRVTRLGAFLRRTSLDELPQLFNVLCRDMSLVGPRPIEDSEIVHYGDRIAYYCAVRPGITGLWQVSGRSNTTYEQRVGLDVRYAKTWSVWADILLLLRTVPGVLRREGAQ